MTGKLSKDEIEELINSDPLTKRHFALEKLKSGELSWKEYIDSLTPEELELERESKRHWAKAWYQNNKGKKHEYSKEYYMKNKDKKQEYAKEYYMKNKDRIAEVDKERERPKVVCECCGSIYTRSRAQRHFRTQKHKNAVEAQNQQH